MGIDGPRLQSKAQRLDDLFHPALLLQEAMRLHFNCEDEEDENTSRMLIRSLVSSTLGFEELARRTKINSKSLHRMLSRDGNPTSRNMATIICCLRNCLDLSIEVQVSIRKDQHCSASDSRDR